MKRRLLIPVGVAAMAASTALALSSEAEHHPGAAHGASLSDLIFPTINFAIFAWIIWHYGAPAIRGWVRERHERVVRALQEAAAAQAEAERLRREWQDRIAHLDQTIEQMRAELRADAERERERILAEAHKTAQIIQRDAERAAANETRRVRQELRADLVRRALQLAEDDARSHWSTDDQQRSLEEFLRHVRQ